MSIVDVFLYDPSELKRSKQEAHRDDYDTCAGAIVDQLLKYKLIGARSHHQIECFGDGVKYTRAEGIIPTSPSTAMRIFRMLFQILRQVPEILDHPA